jgi:hypothetical protein
MLKTVTSGPDGLVFARNASIGLLLGAACGLAGAAPCPGDEPARDARSIDVPAVTTWRRSGEGILGVSTLYFHDDDAFWRQPRVIESLRSIGVSTMRFPGGELADNYDWESHDGDLPGIYPRHANTENERLSRTDFREFLGYSEQAGVEDLFFVVNLDGAFRSRGNLDANLERYAEKAARWVTAVRKSGYRVRYWEIGNESSGGESMPLTVEEYALSVNTFAAAMRAADPSIAIGAAGPSYADGVGFADQLGRDGLADLRANGGNKKKACPGLTRVACIDKFKKGRDADTPVKWWPELLERAGESIDFAVIHRYHMTNMRRAMRHGATPLTRRLTRLAALFERKRDRPLPIALTEWNAPNERKNVALTGIEHTLEISTQLGSIAAGGVEFAHYFPLRSPKGGFKNFLTSDGRPDHVGRLFESLGDVLPGSEAAEFIPSKDLYLVRTKRGDEQGLIIVNRGSTDLILRHTIPEAREMIVRRLTGNSDGDVKAVFECSRRQIPAGTYSVFAPSESLTVVRTIHRE